MKSHLYLIALGIVLSLVTSAASKAEPRFEVATIELASAGEQLEHPGSLVITEKFLLVAGAESNNIAVLDSKTGNLIKVIEFELPVEPHRIILKAGRIVVAGGAKFVTAFDLMQAESMGFKDFPFASICLFPCGSPTTHAAHGAVDYSVTSLLDEGEGRGVVVGVIDRRIHKGALVKVPLWDSSGNLLSGFHTAALEVGHDPKGKPVYGALNPQEKIENPDIVLTKLVSIDDPDGIALMPDGNTIAVIDQTASQLRLIDLASGKNLATVSTGIANLMHPFDFIPHPGDSIELAVTKSGDRIFVSNIRSNTISVVDTQAKQVTRVIHLPGYPGGPYGMTLSPNQKYLFAASWGSNMLVAVDIDKYEVVGTVPVGEAPTAAVFMANGNVAVTNSYDSSISLVTVSGLQTQ